MTGLIVLSGILGTAIGSRGAPRPAESSGLHNRTFEQDTFRAAIAHGDGSLAPQDYFQFHPGQLPAPWMTATEAQSFRRLRDEADLTVSTARVTETLLVAVACPSDAGTWSAEVIGRDGTLRRGSCGELQPQQLPVVSGFDHVRLRIELAGSGRFAVSAYQR